MPCSRPKHARAATAACTVRSQLEGRHSNPSQSQTQHRQKHDTLHLIRRTQRTRAATAACTRKAENNDGRESHAGDPNTHELQQLHAQSGHDSRTDAETPQRAKHNDDKRKMQQQRAWQELGTMMTIRSQSCLGSAVAGVGAALWIELAPQSL